MIVNITNHKIIVVLLITFISIFIGFTVSFLGLLSLVIAPLTIGALLFVFFVQSRLKLYHYVLILVPSIVLSPNIFLPAGPAIRLDDIWLLFGLVVIITKYVFGNLKIKINRSYIVKFFIAFLFWIGLTILLSSFREPYYYSNRDWLEVFKNFKLLAIFITVASLKLNSDQIIKISNMIIFTIFISALFGFMQYLNILGVNSWLTPYFLSDSQVAGFVRNGRVVGTFANPNVFAGFLVIGITLSFSKLLNDSKFIQVFPLLVFLTAMFLTASRTGMVCVVISVITVFSLSIFKNKKRFRLLFLTVISAVIPFTALNLAPDKFFLRMQGLNNISTDDSFQVRLQRWEMIYNDRVRGNILTGTGPVSKLHYYYDNEWLQLLTNYGLIGIFLFLIIFSSIFLTLRKSGKLNKEILMVTIAGQSMIITFAFYMITLAVFQQLQMMPLIMLCFGLGVSVYNNRKEKSYSEPTAT